MARMKTTTATTINSTTNQPQPRAKSLMAMTMRVSNGNAWSRPSNTATNLGTTKVIISMITMEANTMMKAG